MLQAIIFDFDGVLLETSDQLCQGYTKVLSRFGIEYKEEQFNENYGLKTKEHFNKVLLENNISISGKEIDDMVKERDKFYQQICKKERELDLLPGVRKLLDELEKEDIKLGVASSTSRDNLDFFLKKFDILHYFDHTIAGTEVTIGKPDPMIYLMMSDHLQVEPEHCIGIEDTDKGIYALKKANMKAIGVTLTNRKKYDFSKADLLVKTLEELNWKMIKILFYDE